MPRQSADKGMGKGKTNKRTMEEREEGIAHRVPTHLPADEPAPEVEELVADSAVESVATESVACDVGDDELAVSSSSRARRPGS